ncbi:MAG: hypothetical protein QY332_03630 [Anaerolineales bacterium]|nr:MAG: hypothetical protein QY332_03630 [Anaerolineales bacterium]
MSRHNKRSGRGLRFFVSIMLLLALGPSAVGLARGAFYCQLWRSPQVIKTDPGDETMRSVTNRIPEYSRPEDQTYLTLPEWYIVYSADEYGAFLQENSSTHFPYFRAVAQYWQSYYDVCGEVRGRYPRNGSAQFVLGFIGVSFTAENMFKGLYETTIGRVFDWLGPAGPTEEEMYAAQVAQEFGAFLHNTPWYLFPFDEKLNGLWQETSYRGPGLLRKWERKLALTVEYGVKALYGGLTRAGSQATYGGPDTEKIYAVAKGVSDDMAGPHFEIIEHIDDERHLVFITRYEVFSTLVPELMEQGLSFEEIAGNRKILVTLFAPQGGTYTFEYGKYLFDLPILTQPGLTRAAIKVQVDELHLFLEELQEYPDVQFEHIYDY